MGCSYMVLYMWIVKNLYWIEGCGMLALNGQKLWICLHVDYGLMLSLNGIVEYHDYLCFLLWIVWSWEWWRWLGKDVKLTYFMNNVELVGNWVMLVMALENGKMA